MAQPRLCTRAALLAKRHAVGPGEGKRVRAGASRDQIAIFPDASRTLCLSLSLAAGQRRSWLQTRSMLSTLDTMTLSGKTSPGCFIKKRCLLGDDPHRRGSE